MKLKQLVAWFVTVSMLSINIVMAKAATTGYFAGGDGTISNPYRIMTKAQLQNISLYPEAHYILMRDLSFTEEDFEVGGVCAGGWQSPDEFSGVFDGMGNAISNLQGTDGGFVNLNTGTITSVVFKKHKLTGSSESYGAVADRNDGTITGCNVNICLKEDEAPVAEVSGGIAGSNMGTITYSAVTGEMHINGPQVDNKNICTGGIAGENIGTVRSCYNNINHYVQNNYLTEYVYIGGICGEGSVTDCRNDGSMYIDVGVIYDILASPFGNQPGYSSQYCYGSLVCEKPASTNQNENSHKNLNCYNPEEISGKIGLFESTYQGMDFENVWMIMPDGPMPQGIMEEDGNCWSKLSYTGPACEKNGEVILVNQYSETKKEVLPLAGHIPNAEGEGCTREGCIKNIITDLALNVSEVSLTEGESLQLDVTFAPENATDKTLTWTSSDNEVAVVDENGKVTAVSEGIATITVTAVGGKSAECRISVEEPAEVYPESDHPYASGMDETQEYVYKGDEDVKYLKIKFSEDSELENNYDFVYVYHCDGTVAMVYTGNEISGAELNIKGTSFSVRLTTDVSVTRYGYKIESVTPGYDDVSFDVPMTEIYINYYDYYMKAEIGDTYQLDYDVYPLNTTSYLKWSSSDRSIATVDDNGIITVHGYGEVTISAESSDGGCHGEVTIYITDYICIDNIAIYEDNLLCGEIGDIHMLSYSISPSNTTSYVIWSSSDGSVATVNEDGCMTINGYGEVTIRAESSDGGYYCEHHFIVSSQLYMNAGNVTLNVGDSFKFEYVSKSGIDTYPCFYGDDVFFTGNDEGVITAISTGTDYIYDWNCGFEVVLNVTEGYSGYIVNDTYTILAGNEYPLPVTGVDGGYLWGYCEDEDVAVYDSETQTIKAVGGGETSIYTDYGRLQICVIVPYGEFTVENGIITKYSGVRENLIIPEEIYGETIVGIADNVLTSDKLRSVTIPGTITSIGKIFGMGSNVERLILCEGVEIVKEDALRFLSNLKYLELPSSLKRVESCGFYLSNPETIEYKGDFEDWVKLNIEGLGNNCLEAISQTHGQIRTADQLYQIAQAVNNSNDSNRASHKSFTLMNDISLLNNEWTPIGSSSNGGFFGGNFDGNGYTISDYKITTESNYTGFFGHVYEGEIKNLTVENAVIDLESTTDLTCVWTGLLVGWQYYGSVTNCSSSGSITVKGTCVDETNVGGLIGRVSGVSTPVSGCSSDVKINVYETGRRSAAVGGLIGYFYATITDCSADANITYKGNRFSRVGGLCGYQAGDSVSLTGSVARGTISAIISGTEDPSFVGGIVGDNDKRMENNKAYVDIVYSAEGEVRAGNAIGGHYSEYWGDRYTEINNVGYGTIHRVPYVSVSFENSGDDVNCNYNLTAPEAGGGTVFMALYYDENLLGTVKVDNANQTGTVKMKAKPNKYKILGWENMETIAPVHNPLTGVIE